MAELLGIVPICGADDGHAVLTAKAKGMKKAYLKLIYAFNLWLNYITIFQTNQEKFKS